MWRLLLILAQMTATILFIWNFEVAQSMHPVAWILPLVLIVLVIVNSFWFSRLVSWVIFSAGFFSFLVLLSAFTLRWRLETGFDSTPFYRSIIMYAAFVYVSLAQLKIRGQRVWSPLKSEPTQ